MMSTTIESNKCPVCNAAAPKRCQQCKSIWYCSRDHQVQHWKEHKAQCKAIAADVAQAESHTLHKQEFDRIRIKYGLDSPSKAEQIANMIAGGDQGDNQGGVSAPSFAKMFGMSTEEAVVFLEWIKVGVKFKEETLDTAKQAGFGT